jgi:hypothetical protein
MSLHSLTKKYLTCTPSFFKIKDIINSKGKIDHAAFRFLRIEDSTRMITDFKLNPIYKLQPETYTFNNFNASAKWYKGEDEIPRLFISRYRGEIIPNISSYKDYLSINKDNSYIAWTILFEGHINHLALEVDDIEWATEKCIKEGLKMNYEGGLYKVSKDKLLIQTATIAEPVKYTFTNGQTEYVPYTFVELVQRGREGFEQENAKRIFTSTQ